MKRASAGKFVTGRRNWLTFIVSLVTLVMVLSCVVFYLSNQPSDSASGPLESPSTPKAAIVDQLSIHSPNQTFADTVTSILTHAGYTVDYYDWEKVTVNFFRNLPTHNYTLIILRTHSAVVKAEPNYVCIFSSEIFNETKYKDEWKAGRLGRARFFDDDETYYFAITPTFVEYTVKGLFKDATVIMMGCDGLRYSNMAEAFIGRGAESYISWDGPVSTSHTDMATSNLLKHLVTEEQTVPNAVAETIQEVGADPIYLANLVFHLREPS